MNDKAFSDVIDGLKNNTLTKLDLSNQHLGDVKVAEIAKALAHNTSLTHLNLSGNDIKDLNEIIDALKVNKSLIELDFSNNPIKAIGLIILAQNLEKNTSLKTLILENCRLRNTAFDFAYMLRKNNTISSLIFDRNSTNQSNAINIADITAFAGVLENNYTLTDLQVTCDDQSLNNRISSLLERNRQLALQHDKSATTSVSSSSSSSSSTASANSPAQQQREMSDDEFEFALLQILAAQLPKPTSSQLNTSQTVSTSSSSSSSSSISSSTSTLFADTKSSQTSENNDSKSYMLKCEDIDKLFSYCEKNNIDLNDAPKYICCPITLNVLHDPAVLTTSGTVCEKGALLLRLLENNANAANHFNHEMFTQKDMVNTYTSDGQSCPNMAILPGGNFFVTWHDYGQKPVATDPFNREKFTREDIVAGSPH
jgi:hypothetical protein